MSGVVPAIAGGFRAMAVGVALIRTHTVLGARNNVTGRRD
jgi:hypothetical protein